MNAQTKNIVFDWNGTLLDDTHSVLECVNLALASVGQAPIDHERFSDGHNWPLTIEEKKWPLRSFYRDMGLNDEQLDRLRENERHIFHDKYEALSEQVDLRPGAAEILKDFRDAGIHSLILSNHLVDEIRKQLRRFDIERYFAEVLAYANRDIQFLDMTKGERLKRFMADKKIAPENTVIIGDTIEEILIARELGLVSIVITGGTITEKRLRSGNPDYLIHSLHELKPILQERGFV